MLAARYVIERVFLARHTYTSLSASSDAPFGIFCLYSSNLRSFPSYPPRTKKLNVLLLRSSRHLDGLLNAVSLGRVDLFARLGNLGQDRLVGQVGDDLCALIFEVDFVALDA